jgi:hypothetical protein
VKLAYSDFWSSSDNATHTSTARHGIRNTNRYIGSPLQVILEEHRSLHQPLGDLPERIMGKIDIMPGSVFGHGQTSSSRYQAWKRRPVKCGM